MFTVRVWLVARKPPGDDISVKQGPYDSAARHCSTSTDLSSSRHWCTPPSPGTVSPSHQLADWPSQTLRILSA